MPEFTTQPFDSDDNWSPGLFELEEKLSAFSDAPDGRAAVELSVAEAELRVIDASDLLPTPRASLRDEFIAEVAKIEQRRERVRKLPVAVAFVLLVSACVLWPRSEVTQAAAVVSDNPLDSLAETNAGPAAAVSASQQSDSWALVEACASLREQRSSIIRATFAATDSL
ncbi:MAG: hypothetical protein ACYTGL_22740 [Planctomycetota bacterium]|jgi:hypothetical protein